MKNAAFGQVENPRPGVVFKIETEASETPVFERLIEKYPSARPEKIGPQIFVFKLPAAADLPEQARSLLQFLHKKSHLAASIDSLAWADSLVASARLQLGPAMRWVSLRPAPGADARWLGASDFREKLFAGKPLRPEALADLQLKLLAEAENNGYPFAAVWLDSVQILNDGGVSAQLQLARNQYFGIKKIKVHGDAQLPKNYLPQYLGLRPGTPYSRAKILRIRERLADLPFVESTANPTVSFAGDEATVNLFLKKRRAGRFDFIIGLLPNPANERLLLTGSLNAAFQNALNLGERFSAELERLRPETQKLDLQAAVPYCFGLPFGADGRLNLFRRDSTWVDAVGETGLRYLFSGNDFLRVFWENKSTYLQKVDTAAIRQSRRLPPNLDFRQNSFGLETNLSRLDYRFNPRRGWAIAVKGAAGFNTVRRNAQIESLDNENDPSFSFSRLYDSLVQRVSRYQVEARAEFYWPVFVRSTVKIAARGGALISPGRAIFANEQFRLGGNKLMRGFDEESLFASRFAVGTLEYRLIIGQNSWLAAFADAGYLENITDRARVFLRPLGAGAGMTFETKAGIFGISVAVGRQGEQGFDLRAAKFHLGYVSLF